MYTIPYDFLAEEIKKRNSKRIAVQIPEGLKARATKISKELEERTGKEIIVFMDPCFGACDLADNKAISLKAELLIHLGHIELCKSKIDTIFVPLQPYINEKKVAELIFEKIENKFNCIGLCGSIQYTPYLESIGNELEKKGYQVFIGKGTSRVKQPGQILGCNISSITAVEEEVDCIAYIGDGLFHPSGILFSTKKPLFIINPMEESVKEFKELKEEKDKFIRKRFGLISQASHAGSFGILISTKQGQNYMQKALRLKNLIENKGKKAFLFASDFLFPEYYLGVDVDCFVNTACPRLAIENQEEFKKIIINPIELEIALGYKKLADYLPEELE